MIRPLSAWLWAIALALSGCVTVPTVDPEQQRLAEQRWGERSIALAQIQRFTVHARLAYHQLSPVRADVHWNQNANGSYDMSLSGPLGVGAAQVMGDAKRVRVRTREGTIDTDDPEQWMLDHLGWTVPIRQLRHWVLGLPAPDSESERVLNVDGQIERLQQDGWRIEYPEYQIVHGHELPRRILASQDDRSLILVITEWSRLPKPTS